MSIGELIVKLQDFEPETRVVVAGTEAKSCTLERDDQGQWFVEIL